jgi:hypothetical protein
MRYARLRVNPVFRRIAPRCCRTDDPDQVAGYAAADANRLSGLRKCEALKNVGKRLRG